VNDTSILVVDDEANIRELLEEILSEEGYAVTTAKDAAHAREARRSGHFDLTLLDIWMPDTDGISLLKEWADSGTLGSVVMMSGHGTVDSAVEATRLGALDFIEKPVSLNQLLRTVSKALSGRQASHSHLRKPRMQQLIGKSAAMRGLRDRITSVARHDSNAVFTGERGAGRMLAARQVAGLGPRTNAAIESVNGAALTVDEVQGALARAAGGTLLIGDIDRLSVRVQAALLATLPADVRVLGSAISGFERDEDMLPDLLSAIGPVIVRVPPLRDHAEDVPELLRHYTDTYVDQDNLPFRRFGIAAQNRLRNYPWPGNVTELQQLIRQLLVQPGPEEISLSEVESELAAEATDSEPLIKQDLLAMPLREAREHFERAYLQQQLQLCGGKVGRLAKRVGMERTHLYRKLRSLGIDFKQVGQGEGD